MLYPVNITCNKELPSYKFMLPISKKAQNHIQTQTDTLFEVDYNFISNDNYLNS
jgi:hypothetical protein